MSSAEHIFDAAILAPIDGELPKLIYRAQGIIAKDEDAAKVKAIDEARAVVGDKLDLDKIEVLVSRPFVDGCTLWYTPVPYYVPTTPTMPWRPCYPSEPYPAWYATEPVFISGFFGTVDNRTDIKVTTGSTFNGD